VSAHAWCEVQGIGERLPVTVVTGPARGDVLKGRRIEPKRAERMLMLACARPLPPPPAVRLIWGKGVAAAANPQVVTRTPQRYGFTVRKPFTAEFSCEREKASAPCMPIRPMVVRFSAPVTRNAATQMLLRPASGPALAPVFDQDDKSTQV